ncbi:PIN domain-containing protein [Nostoc sp. CHAB 5844]|nr:PIN domain-containing protein [Nostoc sp. CHAB 5844]
MSALRIFFDTNVLVYAHDEGATFHAESATLLNLVLEKSKIRGVIGEQNLVELYRIISNKSAMTGKPLSPNDAKSLIEQTYLNEYFEIVYPTIGILNKTLDLAVQINAVSARIFDVRLASLVLSARVDYFATYNLKDFQGINGISPLIPREILVAVNNLLS